jgi:F-box protein 9
LLHLAIKDVASFVRLSQVCKRLAYLVATEERVWKRIALGHEYGFAAMHYKFARQIDGKPLGDDGEGGYLLGSSSLPDLDDPATSSTTTPQSQAQITASLIPHPYPTYAFLFRTRPRLRFNGCYISTVNYVRPGASSANAISWNTPIHIVTYYRYLRFHRDGSCISLLTVAEPADVVPYLSRDHVHKNHGALPSAPIKDAVLGRWRLTGPAGGAGGEDGEEAEKEGGLMIETPGATPKYIYKMVLAVGSAGRHGCRNNKLSWQGYWSYNKLTDDVGTFSLKNDRPFYWSRVRSWGKGFVGE